jgi:hypothetical protein
MVIWLRRHLLRVICFASFAFGVIWLRRHLWSFAARHLPSASFIVIDYK